MSNVEGVIVSFKKTLDFRFKNGILQQRIEEYYTGPANSYKLVNKWENVESVDENERDVILIGSSDNWEALNESQKG